MSYGLPDLLAKTSIISKYRDQVIAIPLVLYGLGFVITNIHLGSLGIVNFDLFKARYIVVGAMFALFLLSLYLVLTALLKIIVNEKSFFKNLWSAIAYSFSVYGSVIIIVTILTPLSGGSYAPAVWIGVGEGPPSLMHFALGGTAVSATAFRNIAIAVFGLYTLGFIIALIFGPRMLKQPNATRRRILTGGLRGYAYAVLFWLTILAVVILVSYLSALRSSRATGAIRATFTDWSGFTAVHMIIYVLAAINLFISTASPLKTKLPVADGPPDTRLNLFTYFPLATWTLLLFSTTVLPAYALAAYPGIPQQVGGGAPVPAQVTTTNDYPMESLDFCKSPTYLLDRTSRSTIIVVYEPASSEIDAIELMNSEIASIQFFPRCPIDASTPHPEDP